MLKFKIIEDEKECRELWEQFSGKKILWDLWDFRFCFHKKNSEFNFILGFDGKEKEGIIPLVYDNDYNTYTYFGDTFPEKNKFFLKNKNNLRLYLKNFPKPTQVYYIDSEEARHCDFKLGDKRYFLNLEKYGDDFENYIGSFTKKHRKNLRYDLNKLKEKNYIIEKNDIKDFDRLVELNKERFGKDSDYNDKNFVSSIKQLMDIANRKNVLDMVSIKINSNTEAISLGAFFNGIYYVLGVGRNPGIKNLGKLLITEQIKNAISHNCNEVDFMSTEANWKELWNLDSEQMYEFEN
jgi:hypothetical protein